jgi:uncharacterized protein (TIGR02646 family)
MTAGHCAYCDGYELGESSRETIDHFRPKSRFPELAFAWQNLFPACDSCQLAKRDFHEQLLKPDEEGYEFARYFVLNFKTGDLEPNPGALPEEQQKAQNTIALLSLNRAPLARGRLRAARASRRAALSDGPSASREALPYRFARVASEGAR